jgi:hypothetical protein
MVKIRLQPADAVGLNARSVRFGKGALDGDIGSCDQGNADHCNENHSGSRFGHDMYTPCPAGRDGAEALINFLPDEGAS